MPMKTLLRLTAVLLLGLFTIKDAHATHLLGADLQYECLGPGQYLVTLTLYRDCNGVTPASSQTLSYSSATCGVNGSIQLSSLGSPQDITPVCPSVPSACGGSGNYGIQEWLYTGILNLPPGCGADWVLGWSQCCRNNAINTLNGPGSQNMYVGAQLDNTIVPCNNSPTFNNAPGSIVCVNQPVVYNHGVSDADGDSLYFSLGNCFQANGSSVTYNGGFNGTTPLTTSSGVSINPNTGALSFTPTALQVGVLCVNVKEYRNGVLIGEINRDMQFTVIGCSNTPPEASGVNGTPNTSPVNFQTSICANGALCLTIDGSDANGNNVTMSWNNEIFGASFVVNNNGTTSPTAEFCWTPTVNDIGQNVFTVNVEDDACPIIGQGTYTYIIDVLPSPNVLDAGGPQTICFGDSITLNATSTPAALSYTWIPTTSLLNTSGPSVIANPQSTTIYEVNATFPDGCDLTDLVPVFVLQNPVIDVTPSYAFTCSGQPTDLTASGPNIASYTWNPGGLTGANVSVSPSTTTTYTVTAVDNSGCSSTANAVVTIAAPTNNVCNVLYVTPTGSSTGIGSKADPMDLETAMEVGACTGTIIKMAVGDYVTDSTINKITSYLTLEGGFDPAINWDKVSTAGATRILRTATQSNTLVSSSVVQGVGITNETGPNPEVIAINVSNQTGFRFQDITVETELTNPGATMAANQGPNLYGVRLNSCDNYNIVRTQIFTPTGGAGADQIWSIPATNGGNSIALDLNSNGPGGVVLNSFLNAGPAGAGGAGTPNGVNGVSNNLRITGTALSTNDGSFNLAAQPVIQMDDVSCTETVMDFNQSTSNTWTFDSGSSPASATGTTVSTQYSTLGRKDIAYGTENYIGFANIILDAQIIPNFTTSAPFIQGQYRICAGTDVSFTATNGGIGYVYHWDMGGATTPNNYDGANLGSLNNINFPTPGIYTIELQFETNCCGFSIPYSLDIYVEEYPTITITPSVADICYGSTTPVTITVDDNIDGGIISWSPSFGLDYSNTFTVNSLPSDSTQYGITVSDSTGLCAVGDGIDVNVIQLNLSTSTIPTTCGPNGTATVSVSGGSGSYDYQWDDPAAQTTPTATNLAVGVYSVVVTDLGSGCQNSAVVVVNPAPGSLVGFVSNINTVSCAGNGDGSATVGITGGVPPFDYVWSPSGGTTLGSALTSNTTTSLPGGNYDVLITDNIGCTYTVSAFIPEPDTLFVAEDSLFNPTCIGATDGYLSVTVDRGVGPYTLVWDDVNNTTGYVIDSLGVGTYCVGVTDANGCSDTMCFTLTAPLLTDTIFDTICQGETYTLPLGQVVSPLNDTISVDSLVNAIGCDSIVTTFLTVNPVFSTNVDTILCAGQSYISPSGVTFIPSQDTSYVDSLLTVNNCDSLFNISIVVQQVSLESIDTILCQGESVLVNGINYNATGNYLDTAFYNNTGCDSIQFVINIQVDSFVIENIDTTICQGQTLTVNGINYNASGFYQDTAFYTTSGCDSIQYNINLSIDSFEIVQIDTTICQGQSITVNGVSYDQTGTYLDTARYILSTCDSVQYTINLQVDSFDLVQIDTTICQGEILSVNGVDYSSAGFYQDTAFYFASGCDSIQFEINLQIDSFNIENIDTTICEGQSLTVNGITYNAAGLYLDTSFYSLSGCDSIQYVINLQIDSITTVNIDTTICDGDTLLVNGQSYWTTGVYNDTSFHAPSGCINEVFNINLFVSPLPNVEANSSAINNASCVNNTISLFGSGTAGATYTWDNGVTDNVPFNPNLGQTLYEVTGTDALGCINTDTITVIGWPIYQSTISAEICEDEFYTLPDGTIVNTAGSYSVNLPSVNNCDSIIVTVLDVNFIGNFQALEDIAVCDGLSQTISIDANNMVSYEWFVDEGLGNQSLIGNSNYIGANSSELSFNLDTSLHQNVYTVIMVDECGNAYQEDVNLGVYLPTPVSNPLADTILCIHETNVITINYNGRDYQWNTGAFGPSIIPDYSGDYIVNFVENGTNCLLSDTINITIEDCIGNCVVLAPTGFSPNENGTNDIFRAVTTCDEGFSSFAFSIYNRWGELIYFTDNWREGWDGTYKGREAEIGTYTYYVEYTKALTNKKESLSGNITLIR